jgi:23S rRNA pseudouridine1911/1915/1917 synthase
MRAQETPDFAWPEGVPRDATPVPITVIRERAGMRLDKFLTVEMPRLSRTRAARIAAEYAFTTAGVRLSPAKRVRAGETILLFRPAWDEPEAPTDVPVLFQDADLIAVDKPAGLAVHPTARVHRNTLTALLAARYPGERVVLCHRLDKETSGVLLAARSVSAERALKAAFAGRGVHKLYLAVVHGEVREDAFVVDAPLALAGEEVSVLMAVRAASEGGLPSRTRVRVLERLRGFTLVEAAPETGRQHQIRVHLAHAGHAIVGDKLYAHGSGVFLAVQRGGLSAELLAQLLLPRHALHAHAVTFDHPTRAEPITLRAALPADLATFVAAHRLLAEPASPGDPDIAAGHMDAPRARC